MQWPPKALWQVTREVKHRMVLAGPMAQALESSFRFGNYCVANRSHFYPVDSDSIPGFLNACVDPNVTNT